MSSLHGHCSYDFCFWLTIQIVFPFNFSGVFIKLSTRQVGFDLVKFGLWQINPKAYPPTRIGR